MSSAAPDSTPASRIATAVAHLVGPDVDPISPRELERTFDLPGGKELIAWLDAQLCTSATRDSKVALSDISLENEELQIIQRAEALQLLYSTKDSQISLADYVRPSQMQSRAETMTAEANLLEKETAVLKHRLRQTKLASQKAAQTLKSLQSSLKTTHEEVQQRRDALAELTISADTAADAALAASLEVLNPSDPSGCKDTVYIDRLDMISTTRNLIIASSQDRLREIQNIKASLPNPAHVSGESRRLQKILNQPVPQTSHAYRARLDALSLEVESCADESALLRLLDEEESTQPTEVEKVLREAWDADQAAILSAQTTVLGQTLKDLETHILPPLMELYASIRESNEGTKEVEALVGAFLEELEEAVEDVGAARIAEDPHEEENTRQTQLINLLKSLKDLRPGDAPPMYLLEDEDVLNELRRIVAADKTLSEEEHTLVKNLPKVLSAAKSRQMILLNAVYENSPMNTSRPFSATPDIADLELLAHQKSQELADMATQLQKDTEVSTRTRKKIDSFVAKWDSG